MQCTITQIVLLVCFCGAGVATQQQLTLTVVVKYPESLRFSFLSLRGDGLGLNWDSGKNLSKTNLDTYSIALSYTESEVGKIVSMKALADDHTWQIGANDQVKLPSTSSSVDLYPFFYTHAGHYEYPIYNIFSPQLNNTRTMVVYLPPSYRENHLKKYHNVIIMHDGQNLFNASTSFAGVAWQCDKTVDLQVNEGNMEEVVIVGLYNTGQNRINEYTYSYDPKYKAGGEGDLYLDFIRDTVIPYTKKKYTRFQFDLPTLGMVGSSLGGLITCYAGWTRPTEYGKSGCMSSSFWWNSFDFISSVMVKTPDPPPNNQPIYMDVGLAEPAEMLEGLVRVSKAMEKAGMKKNETLYTYEMPGGHHSEKYWGERFWRPMQILYPPVPSKTVPSLHAVGEGVV